MFERDARFRAASRMSDHGNVNGGSGSETDVATTSKVRLDSRVLALEKDKIKLEARLKASEERLETSAATCAELQREKKHLQTELRLMCQKQERLQTQNATHSKGQAQRQDALQQLKQRVEQLEAERSTHKAHVERLNTSFSRAEAEKFAANEMITGLRRKLKEAFDTQDQATERIKTLEGDLQEERKGRKAAQDSLDDLRAVHRDILQRMDQSEAEQRSQLDVLAKTNRLLADTLEEYEGQTDDASKQRAALLEVCLSLGQEKRDLNERLCAADLSIRLRDIRIRRLEDQQVMTLHEEDEPLGYPLYDGTTERACCDHTTARLESDEHEAEAYCPLQAGWQAPFVIIEPELRDLDEQRVEIIQAINVEESEWKGRIIERLQSELKSASAQQRAYLLEHQSQSELREALETARENLTNVEEAYEAGVLDVMQSHEQIELLQGQLNRSKADVVAMSSRIQAFDKIQIELRNAKLRESALTAERQELLEDLSRSSNYEAAYFGIRAEAHKLIDLLAARKIQTQELTSLNAALASNKNPHQKINYLERIRTQLDDARIECRELEQERNALHRQCRDLQARLDTFTHVENGVGSMLSRHQAAIDPAPLDEREAARRAWQMRPKTRFTRIGRHVGTGEEAEAGDASMGRSNVPPRPRLREKPSRGALSDRSNNEFAKSLDNGRVTLQDESGEVTMLYGSDITLQDDVEEPKRRALRGRKSDTALRDRSSPVATLPSFDALAWELDKDHLAPPLYVPGSYDKDPVRSSTPSRSRVANVLDGELSLADLTGTL
jgi:hypothetical protein